MSGLKMKVEVELPTYWSGDSEDPGTSPEEMIVAAISQKLLSEMKSDLKTTALASASKQAEEQVATIVFEQLAGTFQPMTKWGSTDGPPTSMREMIAKQANAFITEKIRRPNEPYRSGYAPGEVTRLQLMIEQSVERAFDQVFKKEVEKATEQMKAQLAGRLNNALTETVSRLLGLPR
jgi:hypothetical protein